MNPILGVSGARGAHCTEAFTGVKFWKCKVATCSENSDGSSFRYQCKCIAEKKKREGKQTEARARIRNAK